MKLLIVIYSLLLLAACTVQHRVNEGSQTLELSENQKRVIMNDQWPFENTLKEADPYVSELVDLN